MGLLRDLYNFKLREDSFEALGTTYWNMSLVAAAGAISRATREAAVPLASWIVITNPPPIPILCSGELEIVRACY